MLLSLLLGLKATPTDLAVSPTKWYTTKHENQHSDNYATTATRASRSQPQILAALWLAT